MKARIKFLILWSCELKERNWFYSDLWSVRKCANFNCVWKSIIQMWIDPPKIKLNQINRSDKSEATGKNKETRCPKLYVCERTRSCKERTRPSTASKDSRLHSQKTFGDSPSSLRNIKKCVYFTGAPVYCTFFLLSFSAATVYIAGLKTRSGHRSQWVRSHPHSLYNHTICPRKRWPWRYTSSCHELKLIKLNRADGKHHFAYPIYSLVKWYHTLLKVKKV